MVEMTAARHMTLPLLGVAVIPMVLASGLSHLLYEFLNRFFAGIDTNPSEPEGEKPRAQLGDDGFGNQFIVPQPINRDVDQCDFGLNSSVLPLSLTPMHFSFRADEGCDDDLYPLHKQIRLHEHRRHAGGVTRVLVA